MGNHSWSSSGHVSSVILVVLLAFSFFIACIVSIIQHVLGGVGGSGGSGGTENGAVRKEQLLIEWWVALVGRFIFGFVFIAIPVFAFIFVFIAIFAAVDGIAATRDKSRVGRRSCGLAWNGVCWLSSRKLTWLRSRKRLNDTHRTSLRRWRRRERQPPSHNNSCLTKLIWNNRTKSSSLRSCHSHPTRKANERPQLSNNVGQRSRYLHTCKEIQRLQLSIGRQRSLGVEFPSDSRIRYMSGSGAERYRISAGDMPGGVVRNDCRVSAIAGHVVATRFQVVVAGGFILHFGNGVATYGADDALPVGQNWMITGHGCLVEMVYGCG